MIVGINIPWYQQYEKEYIGSILSYVARNKTAYARVPFRWSDIEISRGVYSWSDVDRLVGVLREYGIGALGVIAKTPTWANVSGLSTDPPTDTEDFSNFVDVLSDRYADIKFWEIWNEPDIVKFWTGTQEQYVGLLAAAYPVLSGKGKTVISAGLNGSAEAYLPGLIGLGFHQYCDKIGLHPYYTTPKTSLQRVVDIKATLAASGITKPIWVTEIGWDIGALWWHVPTEGMKADYLRMVFENYKYHVEATFWYCAAEQPNGYGVLSIDQFGATALPAYEIFRQVSGEKMGYQDLVLADANLVRYYKLDNDYVDSKGGFTGTPATGVFGANLVAGVGSNCAVMNGSTGYINASDGADIDFSTTTDFTVELIGSMNNTTGTVVLLDHRSAANAGWSVFQTDGAFGFIVSNVVISTGLGTVPSGVFHLVAVCDRDTNVIFYINGVANTSATVTSAQTADSTGQLTIGGRSFTQAAVVLNGSLDEVSIYNSAMTAGAVAQRYYELRQYLRDVKKSWVRFGSWLK